VVVSKIQAVEGITRTLTWLRRAALRRSPLAANRNPRVRSEAIAGTACSLPARMFPSVTTKVSDSASSAAPSIRSGTALWNWSAVPMTLPQCTEPWGLKIVCSYCAMYCVTPLKAMLRVSRNAR
jgi:hypothetical protein